MASLEVVVPKLAAAGAGNQVTATRYERLFTELGYRTQSVVEPTGQADVVVALNAYRSGPAISTVADHVPVVVVLTGTDVYRFMDEHPARVRGSLDRATRLVGLNDRVGDTLTTSDRAKLTIIKEGAAVGAPRRPDASAFDVAVIGHLRDEKNPKLVAEAVADLGPNSPVRVRHYGDAYSEQWSVWADAETAANTNWEWCGYVPRDELGEVYATSNLLVNSSEMEGGANVISEAVMARLPILASEIPGNVGVLGSSYPGYFAPDDANDLRTELLRLQADADRLEQLTAAVEERTQEFTEEREQQGWQHLLAELVGAN